jgi:hypothetical protein
MISFFVRDAVDPTLEVVPAAEYQALKEERDQLRRLLYRVVRRRGGWGQVAEFLTRTTSGKRDDAS